MVGLGVVEVLIIAVVAVVALLGLALAVGIGIWLVRRVEPAGSSRVDAIAVLKRRLAAGEIDEETYERLRRRIAEE